MTNRRSCIHVSIVGILSALLLAAGCSEKIEGPGGDEIGMKISVPVNMPASTAQLYLYELTVTGPGIIDPIVIPLAYENYYLVGEVVVPAGPDRKFRIEVHSETGTILYYGETVADVYPGSATTLDITLYPAMPMVKLSPMYISRPQETVLAIKVLVFNIPDLSRLNMAIYCYNANQIRPYFIDYEVNPELADVVNFSITYGNYSDYVSCSHINANQSFVDSEGYAEIATIYYDTDYTERPIETYTFSPSELYLVDRYGNQMSSEGTYTDPAVAELYPYESRFIADWQMDQYEAPSFVPDYSDNMLHGTAIGTTFVQYGAVSYMCRYFNGKNDYIYVPDSDLLDVDGSFTLSLWYYLASGPQAGGGMDAAPAVLPAFSLISKSDVTGRINYQIMIVDDADNDGHYSILFRYGSSTIHTYKVNIPDEYIYDWNHVVFSFEFGDPSSALVVFGNYSMDKVEGAWVTGDGKAMPPFTNAPLLIGRDNSDTGHFYQGRLDEIEFVGEALTLEEIVSIYARGA